MSEGGRRASDLLSLLFVLWVPSAALRPGVFVHHVRVQGRGARRQGGRGSGVRGTDQPPRAAGARHQYVNHCAAHTEGLIVAGASRECGSTALAAAPAVRWGAVS